MTAAGLFAPLRGGFPPGRGRAGVAIAGGEGFPPVRGRLFPALTGGADWRPAMAGSLHGPKEKSKGTRLRGRGTVPTV